MTPEGEKKKVTEGEVKVQDVMGTLSPRIPREVTREELEKMLFHGPKSEEKKSGEIVKGRLLGHGSFAHVFLGVHNGKQVAIKEFKISREENPDEEKREK